MAMSEEDILLLIQGGGLAGKLGKKLKGHLADSGAGEALQDVADSASAPSQDEVMSQMRGEPMSPAKGLSDAMAPLGELAESQALPEGTSASVMEQMNASPDSTRSMESNPYGGLTGQTPAVESPEKAKRKLRAVDAYQDELGQFR